MVDGIQVLLAMTVTEALLETDPGLVEANWRETFRGIQAERVRTPPGPARPATGHLPMPTPTSTPAATKRSGFSFGAGIVVPLDA
jgi:hypothetical protein